VMVGCVLRVDGVIFVEGWGGLICWKVGFLYKRNVDVVLVKECF